METDKTQAEESNTALAEQPPQAIQAEPAAPIELTEEEQKEADARWSNKLDYICGRTREMITSIVRLHWEEGEFLSEAFKNVRHYGNATYEKYVQSCRERGIETSESSVRKYVQFYDKYKRDEMEELILKKITWYQISNALLPLPSGEAREKLQEQIAQRKFKNDEEVKAAARKITHGIKAKKKAKGEKVSNQGGLHSKVVFRSTAALCEDMVRKLEQAREEMKAVSKLEEDSKRSQLDLAIRDMHTSMRNLSRRLDAMLESYDGQKEKKRR